MMLNEQLFFLQMLVFYEKIYELFWINGRLLDELYPINIVNRYLNLY